jgi:hypothetical protein
MEIQEIEVTIGKNGQVQIHVRGAKGKKCLDLTRELEQALGAAVVDREMTSESLEDGSGNLIEQTVKTKSGK